MRRSRLTAVVVAVAVAMSALLVPGTAQADVTDASLSVDFDNLSADRIATVTLKAGSAGGITDVQAAVEQRPDGEWATIGTLPFTRVDGTANDGTWKAEYKADIEAHPGPTWFRVEIKSADGATLTRRTGFDNCYQGAISDLTTTPDVVDFDNREVTVRGRVLVRKTRESGLEPAPDVTVNGGDAPVRTGTDGSFVLTDSSYAPYAPYVYVAGPRVCSVSEYAPRPEFDEQQTEMSARLVDPGPVAPGAGAAVEGKLLRRGVDGLVPVEGTPVEVSIDGMLLDTAYTAENGTFRSEFTAERSGTVLVTWPALPYLMGGTVSAGYLTVQPRARILDFAAPTKPAPYGETMRVSGRLADGGGPIGSGEVRLEFAGTRDSGWTVVSTGRTGADGAFSLGARAAKSGYWRVRAVGGDGRTLVISEVVHVDVKYRLQLNDLKVEQSGSGGTVAVRGNLVRFADEAEPADQETVFVYFMPKGGSSWEYQGWVGTGADGTFEKAFTAPGDGYWTAASWEDADHLSSNAPITYLDVTVEYATEIVDFSVAPASVTAGETITVRGRLTRLSGDDEPAPLPNKPIYLYSMPDRKWTQAAVVTTDADGWFEKTFTAEESGYWTAWFWGDARHAKSNPWVDYVEVQ